MGIPTRGAKQCTHRLERRSAPYLTNLDIQVVGNRQDDGFRSDECHFPSVTRPDDVVRPSVQGCWHRCSGMRSTTSETSVWGSDLYHDANVPKADCRIVTRCDDATCTWFGRQVAASNEDTEHGRAPFTHNATNQEDSAKHHMQRTRRSQNGSK